MWIKTAMSLWLILTIQEKDYDGVYNHLLETRPGPGHQYAISISTDLPIEIEPGQEFRASFKGECDKVWMLEDNKGVEAIYPYGVPRRATICNASAITINGRTYKQSHRRNNE